MVQLLKSANFVDGRNRYPVLHLEKGHAWKHPSDKNTDRVFGAKGFGKCRSWCAVFVVPKEKKRIRVVEIQN
jgi:hypothetical protein